MSVRSAFKSRIRHMLEDPSLREVVWQAISVYRKDPYLLVSREDGSSYEIPFADVYCQVWRADSVCFEAEVAAALAWQDILAGRLVYRFIEVREPPQPDKEIEANREILKDMVSVYNEAGVYDLKGADFWGGTQDEDGYVEFNSPFIDGFEGFSLDELGGVQDRVVVEGLKGSLMFPLEVGYCESHQMVKHLSLAKCVARFPYKHPYIVFLQYLPGLG